MSARREKRCKGRKPLFELAKLASADCSRALYSRFMSIKRIELL
jgi:hypothetical protein